MLRIVSFNANGIRSATDKGFWKWFDAQNADFLCVQELKAQESDLDDSIRLRSGYAAAFHCAVKKGYSGCGLWSRVSPQRIVKGFGVTEFDNEGRYVRFDFDRLSVVSVYFPSGTSGDDRQQAKYRFLDVFRKHMSDLAQSGREIIVCGDMNIAHKNIDLKNWRSNQEHSGFLPEERAWMTDVLEKDGWKDVFRLINQEPDQYTWWSQRGQARAKNVGWRIDYELATPAVAQTARDVSIYAAEKFSDHAPLMIDYEFSLA